MIRRPKSRGISLIASSSLVALMLLVPAGASAATPIVITAGPGAATPQSVSPSEPVLFGTVSLTNNDSSTISQLTLTTLDKTLTVASATSDQGKCATTGALSCTFRNVKPLDTVSAFVVLNAKSADFGVVFRWDTTGQAGDKGGNSHGDSFYWPHGALQTDLGNAIPVAVNGDTTNYRSRYVLTSTQQKVFNDPSINSTNNKQSTQVNAPSTGIPATVQDGLNISCPSGVACFGEASVIDVNGGALYTAGFQVILQFDSSEIPGGVNANTIQIYHESAGYQTETISAKCTLSGGVPTSLPCLTAKKINGNDLQVTIWTTHNGVIHGLG